MIRALSFAAILAASLATTSHLHAQAADIPLASPPADGPPNQTPEQRGRALIDKMVEALGGQAWLDRTTIEQEGHGASFFHGQPNLGLTDFREYHRLPGPNIAEGDRIEFSKKHDVIQVWTPTSGTEITYKGNSPLPKDQVEDTLRRRAHSIEAIIHTWIDRKSVV